MKEETKRLEVRSVKNSVKLAIKKYCLSKGITQSYYLEKDKRLKKYL